MTVHLVKITLEAFEALAAEDVTAAERLLGLPIPAEFAEALEIWEFMIRLLGERPENADWAMNAVVTSDTIVGNAGFKGAPVGRQVELGYRISPDRRREGLALAAVHLLLDRCARDPDVDRVIARIRPDNDASVGVVSRAGFMADGEHINPRWGRQLQFVHETPIPDR